MKFARSHRQLNPNNQYTPPCNYYQPQKPKSLILTGSLLGPSLLRQKALFGQQRRFNATTNPNPGPGSYQNCTDSSKTPIFVEQRQRIRQTSRMAFIATTSRSPSIPYDHYKQDQDELEFQKEILMNEDPNRSALSLKKKNQGFTFSKSPRSVEKKELSSAKQAQTTPLQSISEYTLQKQSKRQQNLITQQVKKSNQRRKEIINMINPQFVPSLELIELITKRRTKYIPGPGTYYKQEPEYVPEVGPSFSSSRRFTEDQKVNLGPGEYRITEQKVKSASFSKSARNLFNLKGQTDIQHRFYIDPYKSQIGQKQSSTKKLQPFGSNVIRFCKLQKQPFHQQQSLKSKKISRLQQIVEKKLKKLYTASRKTCESEGLLGISTMASTID